MADIPSPLYILHLSVIFKPRFSDITQKEKGESLYHLSIQNTNVSYIYKKEGDRYWITRSPEICFVWETWIHDIFSITLTKQISRWRIVMKLDGLIEFEYLLKIEFLIKVL